MRADGADPAGSLAAPVRASIRNVAHFWELDAWLSGLATEPGCDPAARCDLVELRRALLSYLDEKYQLDPPSASKELPIATPIVLEVGDALVPKVNPEVDGGRFIDRDIDAMRKDIEAGTGVTVPGIHVRGNPALARDGYVIMLDEAPQAEGRVEIDYVYVTAAEGTIATLGISTDRLIGAQDPSNGDTGWWAPAEYREKLESSGVKWRAETDFILCHVSDVLRRNLASFLGYHEVDALLSRLPDSDKTAAPAGPSEVLSRLRFARLLRALVREQVPITAWRTLLHGVPDLWTGDLAETLPASRRLLQEQLPGKQPSSRHYRVPPEWEGFLASAPESGTTRFEGTPFETHGLLLAVRSLVRGAERDAALVTPTPALRPYVRRLVESEFPWLRVLSEDELLTPAPTAAQVSAYDELSA